MRLVAKTISLISLLAVGCAWTGREAPELGPAPQPPCTPERVAALAASKDPADAVRLDQILTSGSPKAVRCAVSIIRITNDARFYRGLFHLAASGNSALRAEAFEALLETTPDKAHSLTIGFFTKRSVSQKDKVGLIALADRSGSRAALRWLARMLDETQGELRAAILASLRRSTLAAPGESSRQWLAWLDANVKTDLRDCLRRQLAELRRQGAEKDAAYDSLRKSYLALARRDVARAKSPDEIGPYLADALVELRLAALERTRSLKLKALVPDVAEQAGSRDGMLRAAAFMTLAALGDQSHEGLACKALLHDSAPSVRLQAVLYLNGSKAPASIKALVAAARSDVDPTIRSAALGSLAEARWPEAAGMAVEALKSDKHEMREAAAAALGKVGAENSVNALAGLLADPNARVRYAAADSLGQIGSRDAVPALIGALRDREISVAQSAVAALARIGDERAIGPLEELLESPDAVLARLAWRTMLGLCNKEPARLLELARRLTAQKDRDRALMVLTRLTEQVGPNAKEPNPRLLLDASAVYGQLALPERALATAGMAAHMGSADEKIWIAYTALLERSGKESELWSACSVALGRFRGASAATWWEGKFRLIERLVEKGNSKQAVVYINEVSSGVPEPMPESYRPRLKSIRDRLSKPGSRPRPRES